MLLFQHMFTANMASSLKLPQLQIAWLPLKSPCVREHISIVVQLAFLVLLLLQFVRKSVSLICRKRTEVRDQGVERYTAGVKFNISYRITIVCSTLLFATHLIMLLIMLNGGEILCDSKVLAFSSEVMQVVLWASTLLTVYKIPSNKYAKFPWILRAWWFCSFSLYIICTALDAYSRVTNHSQFKVGDYSDFVCLLPSTLLFGISIRGKTGLVYALTNDTTEPLINGKTDTPLEYKRESLYGKATLFQLVTFSWLNPLFAVGIRKPLDQNEIPDVDIKDSAEFLSHDFDERLKHVKQKDGSVNPSMYKAIFLFIRKKAAINALLAVISAASTDQSVLDLELAGRLGTCASTIIQIIGTIAVMSQAAWQVFVIFIPVTAICIWYQQYYIPTARELARLIHTVIDSDLVLVLNDGRIAEYDSPKRLLEREDSFFSKLIKEYSMRSQNFNTTQQST
ncbi:hypothetical protein Q3G72_025548 [Acer saccharum]|nr:hypothetical protein Q3G72_025548 [Acer saccharum]